MVNPTKLSGLSKLKEFSHSLVEKTENLVNTVKTTVNDSGSVNELVNKVKSSVGMNALPDDDKTLNDNLQEPAQAIQQALDDLYHSQKQQLDMILALKKQVRALLDEKTPSTPGHSKD